MHLRTCDEMVCTEIKGDKSWPRPNHLAKSFKLALTSLVWILFWSLSYFAHFSFFHFFMSLLSLQLSILKCHFFAIFTSFFLQLCVHQIQSWSLLLADMLVEWSSSRASNPLNLTWLELAVQIPPWEMDFLNFHHQCLSTLESFKSVLYQSSNYICYSSVKYKNLHAWEQD